MTKNDRKQESDRILNRPSAPTIIVTASSDDSRDVADVEFHDKEKPLNGLADGSQDGSADHDISKFAPPEAEMQNVDREAKKNWIFALILQLAYICLVVASSQLTSSTFNDEKYKPFKPPYLFIWCKICMRILAFPCIFLIQSVVRLVRREPLQVSAIWQHCTKTLRHESGRISFRVLLIKFLPMSVTMLLMQIGWVVGLVYAPASIITALCSATIAFSYILSWLVLKNKMLLIKGLFVIVAFVGIGLISYASTIASYIQPSNSSLRVNGNGTIDVITEEIEGSGDDGQPVVFSTSNFSGVNVYIGVFCGIGAGVFYSFHQLSFKIAFPKADLVQVSMIMSIMSFVICLIYLPVPVTLNAIGKEIWAFSKMPMHMMFLAWFVALISSVCYAYGLALSNPFFMSVAEVMIVALNTGIDTYVREIPLNELQIAGTAVVAVAFVFMVMPDQWLSVNLAKHRQSGSRKDGKENGPSKQELEELNPVPNRTNDTS